jgi:succinyl-CoA synthetase alpha subunit
MIRPRGARFGRAKRFARPFLYDRVMPVDVAVVSSLIEARRALETGQHVFLTHDDFSVDDELALKTAARERALLVISRTAILDGTPLGLANDVRRGTIGIIGTAGSAIQEVTTLIHQLGAGVSQAIRSGNRDLTDFIGGLATLAAIDLLAKDDATSLLVLLAKGPSSTIARRILDDAAATGKPVVACFLGVEPTALPTHTNVKLLTTFEGAALAAATQTIRSFRKAPGIGRPALDATVSTNRYCLRGLYSGGALAYEALSLLSEGTPQIGSNLTFRGSASLAHSAETHTIVALSQGGFREGRAHPIIDPTVRIARIRDVATDPRAAILLLDVILGHGAHPDPAGALLDAIGAVRSRHIVVIASVIGTDDDPQHRAAQVDKLSSAGVIVARSNAAATRYALGALGLVALSSAMLDDMTPLTEEVPAVAGTPLFGKILESTSN